VSQGHSVSDYSLQSDGSGCLWIVDVNSASIRWWTKANMFSRKTWRRTAGGRLTCIGVPRADNFRLTVNEITVTGTRTPNANEVTRKVN
jgi:hypothetical protein